MSTNTASNFPMFDGHMHFCQAYIDDSIASWEENNVIGGINLWGAAFGHYKDMYAYPLDYTEFLQVCAKKKLFDRFTQFWWPDWRDFGKDPAGFVAQLCSDLRKYADLGCRGLKVWKDLGMFTKFADGTPAFMDDPRLMPVWETCQTLKFTISIHTADPLLHFNESSQTGISREELYERRDHVIAAFPLIRFILCHSGNYIVDLKLWAKTFDRFPYLNSDLCLNNGSITPEWTNFLEKYSDRFYIGADLALPLKRPPDRPWSKNEVYDPWRRGMLTWNLKPETLEKIAWRNGARDFIRAKI